MFIGTNVTFDPQYLLGLRGFPRRIAEYAATEGYTTLNRISSAVRDLFISVALFVINVVVSWWVPIPAGDNPWDAATLEWATTSPPPHHNFLKIPPIRSRRPVWDRTIPSTASSSTTPSRAFPGCSRHLAGRSALEDIGLDGAATRPEGRPMKLEAYLFFFVGIFFGCVGLVTGC